MINQISIQEINKNKFSKYFLKPSNKYSFTKILNTAEHLLTNKKNKDIFSEDVFNKKKDIKNVVLFVIDGFGWSFFEKMKNEHPIFKKIEKQGIISKLTSQFPSTTTNEITTITTNLTTPEHCLYEWNYFESKVNKVISPILMTITGEKMNRDELLKINRKFANIIPKNKFYLNLKKQNIDSFAFQSSKICNNAYSNRILFGSKQMPFETLTQGLLKLTNILNDSSSKKFCYFYFDSIDAMSHEYGPDSEFVKQEILNFFNNFETNFLDKIDLKNTTIMITADHGQVALNKKSGIYLNKKYPSILKYLKTDKDGKYIVPVGSPRDFFLHIKNEYLNKVLYFLRKKLVGKAEVYKTRELIKEGIFGDPKKITKKFLKRVGNLVILPYKNESVWWYKKGVFEFKFNGHHGGLTPEEMEIPLIYF